MPKRPAARRATPKPTKSPAVARRILHELFTQHPNADTELHYSNPYELLVATILSAQCTDARVNQVTPALFRRYPDARTLAKATTDELEPQIQSTGFFRAKSRSLVGMSTEVVERHAGEIPRTMAELTALPGVGRKTANVVLGHALGVPGLPVDRHVLRVSNRIGIARSDDPVVVEQQLNAALPPAEWTQASDTLILHGRRICKPRPLCDRCIVRKDCDFYQQVQRLAVQRPPGRGRRGSLSKVRRAAKPRGSSREGEAPQPNRLESGSVREVRRAPKARGSGRKGDTPPENRPESGWVREVRRAPTARGTGRGGGAPRQTKK